jgi:transposase
MSSRAPIMDHIARARRRREIAQALRAGMHPTAAAAKFGVKATTVSLIIKDYDVPRRIRGRKPKAWPEIPDELRDEFRRLCRRMPAESARARLEEGLAA